MSADGVDHAVAIELLEMVGGWICSFLVDQLGFSDFAHEGRKVVRDDCKVFGFRS